MTASPQVDDGDAVASAGGELPREAFDGDDGNFEETPWLFCAQSVDSASLPRELGFMDDELRRIDAGSWNSVEQVASSLVRSGLLASALSPKGFWKALLQQLSFAFSREASVLIVVDAPDATETVRSFVSVVAEAFDAAEDPGQVLMVLCGCSIAELATVDVTLTDYAKENDCYDVVTLEAWREQQRSQ